MLNTFQVMRKDPSNECITPSNPQGLALGYGIQLGECLTMQVSDFFFKCDKYIL